MSNAKLQSKKFYVTKLVHKTGIVINYNDNDNNNDSDNNNDNNNNISNNNGI